MKAYYQNNPNAIENIGHGKHYVNINIESVERELEDGTTITEWQCDQVTVDGEVTYPKVVVALIRERMETAAKIGEYKRENNLPVYDPARERELFERVGELAGEEFASYAKVLYSTMTDVSRSYQRKLMGRRSGLAERMQKAIDKTDKLAMPQFLPASGASPYCPPFLCLLGHFGVKKNSNRRFQAQVINNRLDFALRKL